MARRTDRIVAPMALLAWLGLLSTGCANSPGAEPDCPTCDNVTELLVGFKCVPIEEVAACGPDGHAHGGECHCFSGQEPTEIDGTEYCLQADCQEPGERDLDALACEESGETPEAVTAVQDFADFELAHVDLEHLAEISLPAGAESYVHFPADGSATFHVYLDTEGALNGVLDAQGEPVTAEAEGANPDCPDEWPEVWHVAAVNDSGQIQPQILHFSAGQLADVRVLVYELEGDHHD